MIEWPYGRDGIAPGIPFVRKEGIPTPGSSLRQGVPGSDKDRAGPPTPSSLHYLQGPHLCPGGWPGTGKTNRKDSPGVPRCRQESAPLHKRHVPGIQLQVPPSCAGLRQAQAAPGCRHAVNYHPLNSAFPSGNAFIPRFGLLAKLGTRVACCGPFTPRPLRLGAKGQVSGTGGLP